MNVRLLDIALLELEDAVDYYNYESPGLGYDFADEVFNTIDRVVRNPVS